MAFCESCDFAFKCSNNCMSGVGPSKAKIMIVGECPSWTDDEVGEPFQGDGGSKLDYILDKAGLDRDSIYVTTAIKCKPFRPSDIGVKHVKACEEHLMREILAVRPKVIISMGKASLIALKGEGTVKDFRGHPETFELDYVPRKSKKERTFRCELLPTYSPVASLTKWEYNDYLIHDLKKVKQFLKDGEFKKTPRPEYKLVLTIKELKEFVERYSNVKSFNTDFETTGLRFHEHSIINSGFADNTKSATIVPMHCYGKEHINSKKWTKEDRILAKKINKFVKKNRKKIFKAVKKVMASPAKKILHNGKFDAKFAKYHGVPIKNFDYDTCIGDALVDENKYHDLNSCMEYRGINYGAYDTLLWPHVNKDAKKKKSYLFIPPIMMCEYLAIDVCGDRRLWKKQKKEIKREEMQELLYERQMPLSHVMMSMEYLGCKFNRKRLRKIAKVFDDRLKKLEKQLRKLTKLKELNPNSSDQLREFFEDNDYPFEEFGIKKGKKGYSCGEETLKAFARKRKFAKIPKLVLEHRALAKTKGTFLDGKDGDGGLLTFIDTKSRIHANWNLHTPRTGRLSCNSPNLQQIPRPNPLFPDANIRQLFKPTKKDWVLFSADFAQLELRVAAFMSQDRTMIKEFQNGVDLHTRNCVKFGTTLGFLPSDMTEKKFAKIRDYKPPKNWEKKYKKNKKKLKKIEKLLLDRAIYDEHRVFAKSLGFGLNYGMDANTLSKNHGIDIDEVQEMIDIYFEKYNALYDWRFEQCEKAIDDGILILPETGRKRRFTQASDWFNSDYSQDCRKREFDISAIHRQAMNFPIQGYANEIYVAGKLKLEKAMKKKKMKSRLILSIHDGLIGEGPVEEMKELSRMVKKYMESVLGKGKWQVPLNVDFELYSCWYGKKLNLEDMDVKKVA